MSDNEKSPLERGKLEFGQRSSNEAQALFRHEILDKAVCPICRSTGLAQFNFTGKSEDQRDEELMFVLPVMMATGSMFPIGGIYLAACRNCGFIAQFFDAAVQGRAQGSGGENV